MNLTEHELLARDHFMNLVINGKNVPITECDDGFNFNLVKPNWFNEDKYELGRQYFKENRAGILSTNLLGLILVLSMPSGLRILHGTGESSTPITAQNRYVDTVLHTVNWYDFRLDNSTKSWNSLRTVRQLHGHASYTSQKKDLGFITQREVSMTTFGFAGFVILRPHLFGIRSDERSKREGFMHLWAVLNYMLGVRDEFNIGLLPLEVVEIEFDIIMRNVLSAGLQLETPLFKRMVKALIEGMSPYIPFLDYETQLFLTRRAVGIPGYQYRVDMKKELPRRNIFTKEDIAKFDEGVFTGDFLLIKAKYISGVDLNNNNEVLPDKESQVMVGNLHKFFELPESTALKIKEIPRSGEKFMANLSDKKYNKLSMNSKMYVQLSLGLVGASNNFMGRYLVEQITDNVVAGLRRQRKERYNKSKK